MRLWLLLPLLPLLSGCSLVKAGKKVYDFQPFTYEGEPENPCRLSGEWNRPCSSVEASNVRHKPKGR